MEVVLVTQSSKIIESGYFEIETWGAAFDHRVSGPRES
jgi:hypothetical protein